MKVAVIAHSGKTLGDGLPGLRRALADEGVVEPLWYEVPKSRKAPPKALKAYKRGAELIFIWGGDGMVQRCADALAGTGAEVAIVPAGTANLFASNLGIPEDLAEAVRIGMHGARKRVDLGKINGEHFAVMAGAGFDGEMIRDADKGLKNRLGRLSYAWTGARHVRDRAVPMRVEVDGAEWFAGAASCVLLGNVGMITGGIQAFDDARPDSGRIEVGVATAEGAWEWARTLGKMAAGRSDSSPFVKITSARKVKIRTAEPLVYELDGGARKAVRKIKAKAVPGALTVCVPK
jgi:YegS/Rv2252/BmrU family lipid kinase